MFLLFQQEHGRTWGEGGRRKNMIEVFVPFWGRLCTGAVVYTCAVVHAGTLVYTGVALHAAAAV